MTSPITPKEAREYLQRWQAVNAAELEELNRMTPDEKLLATAQLMEFARAMGWFEELAQEEAQVRETWRRIREYYAAQK